MKKLILLGFICCFQTVWAAEPSLTISGVITDAADIPLPYVNVKAQSDIAEKMFVAQSDANGEYKMAVSFTDSCVVTYSYIGYKSLTYIFYKTSDETTVNDVCMSEDTTALKEVVVNGRIAVHEQDKTIFFPTEAQRKSANNGARLLYNMMIPELIVDRNSGSATTLSKKAVTRCINGVEATQRDINALRPKDIIRIDFYPVTSGKFARYDAVIDYVVKVRRHGGYAEFNTTTTIPSPRGDYDATLKYHVGKWEHLAVGGMNFQHITDYKGESTEWVNLEPSFTKYSSTKDYKNNKVGSYGYFRSQFNDKRWLINMYAGIVSSKTRNNDSSSSSTYEPEVFPPAEATTKQTSSYLSPYVYGYARWNIKGSNYISASVSYDYGHSKYDRNYNENTAKEPLLTYTTEDSHSWGASISYWRDISDKGNITLTLNAGWEKYRDKYSGSTTSEQDLNHANYNAFVKFRYRFSKKLFLQADAFVQAFHSRVNGIKEDQTFFKPQLYLSYNMSERSSLVLNLQSGHIEPSSDKRNPSSQYVNYYTILRGNDSIRRSSTYETEVTYSHSWDKFRLALNAYAFFLPRNIRDDYYIENNYLVHSYCEGESTNDFWFTAQATAYMLNRQLQLSPQIGYIKNTTNDDGGERLNNFVYGMEALYYIGDFSFSAYFASKQKWAAVGATYNYQSPYTYGFSASFNKGNWYVSLDADNIFSKNAYQKEWKTFKNYTMESKSFSCGYHPSVTLKVCYNFDFGRKKLERTKTDVNKTVKSAILHP